MGATRIEFCHETLNPLVGCSRVSPGCDNCYALRMARRHEGNPKTPQYHGLTTTRPTTCSVEWTGEVRWVDGVLEKAKARLSKSRKRRRIFMVSMGDLFHDRVLGLCQFDVFRFMRNLPMHDFIVITKRPANMAEFALDYWRKPLPNVILMATCEDQQRAEERLWPMLMLSDQGWKVGAVLEPLLGLVDLERVLFPFAKEPSKTCGQPWGNTINVLSGQVNNRGRHDYGSLGWVVVGHEQGHGKRDVPIQYSGAVAAQCARAGVPCFFKKDSAGQFPADMPRQFPKWMLAGEEASA